MSRKINISVFFDEPVKEFGVRECARIWKVSPATASKYLNDAFEQHLLKCRRERNMILYKADEESVVYKDEKKFENIRRIRNSGLLEFIIKHLREPLAVFLFGSFAKGENRQGSDIDIAVLSRTKKGLDLIPFERILQAKIQLFVFSPEEISRSLKKNPNLLNNIINGTRLYGFWEVFDV